MAFYGPGIDQSEHAKSVSHMIIVSTGCTFAIFHPHKPTSGINAPN